jgi:hypothetical protein
MSYEDYRYQDYQATQIAQDSTSPNVERTSNQSGTVIAASETQYDSEHVLSFPLPNVTAMCLDVAYTTWVESQHFLQDERFLKFFKPATTKGIVILTEDNTFFDLLQKRMVAIVFAYTALESFANESIPDHFIFRRITGQKKFTEEYTKEQAERLSLEIKLFEVLPEIFKLLTPKGRAVGERYKALEKLRDRVIHMKSKDRRISVLGKENIWKDLLEQFSPNVGIEAKDIIGYYLESLDEKDRPRWYRDFPW